MLLEIRSGAISRVIDWHKKDSETTAPILAQKSIPSVVGLKIPRALAGALLLAFLVTRVVYDDADCVASAALFSLLDWRC